MDGMSVADDTWTVAGRTFRSRLIVGTGRYKDLEETGAAIEASARPAIRTRAISFPFAGLNDQFRSPPGLPLMLVKCGEIHLVAGEPRVDRDLAGLPAIQPEVLPIRRTHRVLQDGLRGAGHGVIAQ